MNACRSASRPIRQWIVCATALAVLATRPTPIASQTIPPNTASWYCHDGALLLHAGHKNSTQNSPIDWDVTLLGKAGSDFTECYRLATNSDDFLMRIYAWRGYAQAHEDIAETMNAFSLSVFINEFFVRKRNPQKYFLLFHNGSLKNIRWALQAIDNAKSALMNITPDVSSTDEWLRASNALDDDGRIETDIKQRILATTFEGVPRTMTELMAFMRAGRVPSYTLSSEWGLVGKDLCPTKSTDIKTEGADVSGAPTAIEVTVRVDGTLKAAHILASSGQRDVDEAALTKVYSLKYHAGSVG